MEEEGKEPKFGVCANANHMMKSWNTCFTEWQKFLKPNLYMVTVKFRKRWPWFEFVQEKTYEIEGMQSTMFQFPIVRGLKVSHIHTAILSSSEIETAITHECFSTIGKHWCIHLKSKWLRYYTITGCFAYCETNQFSRTWAQVSLIH